MYFFLLFLFYFVKQNIVASIRIASKRDSYDMPPMSRFYEMPQCIVPLNGIENIRFSFLSEPLLRSAYVKCTGNQILWTDIQVP